MFKKLGFALFFSGMFMGIPAVYDAPTSNVAEAYEGEDPYEMVDRCFFHSGLWLESAGTFYSPEMMATYFRIDTVDHSDTIHEYAQGLITVLPPDGSECQGGYELINGKYIIIYDPADKHSVFRFVRG